MIEHVLADDDLDESDVQPAPKLMEIVLQNCRGRVDACVPPYLSLALRRLHASRSPYMQARLFRLLGLPAICLLHCGSRMPGPWHEGFLTISMLCRLLTRTEPPQPLKMT